MVFSQLQELVEKVSQLIRDGFTDSAFREFEEKISDLIPEIVLSHYRIDADIRYLIHYTSIDVLFSILTDPRDSKEDFLLASVSRSGGNDKTSFIRLYDTVNSNDPNEGQFFVNERFSSNKFVKKHQKIWNKLKERKSFPAYIASFVGAKNVNDADDLVYWRTYGKDGRGCAIVIPVSYLESEVSLFQIKYGVHKVYSALNHLFNALKELEVFEKSFPPKLENKRNEIQILLAKLLSNVPYLHKSIDYKFEKEIRVVLPFFNLESNRLYSHKVGNSGSNLKLRHYINHKQLNARKLFRSDSYIFLGPAVSSLENTKFVLGQRLKYLELTNVNLKSSAIDYRP